MDSDIRVLSLETTFQTIQRRTSFVFAKGTMSENLVCNIEARVATASGTEAVGRGSIHLAAPWSFPSSAVPLDQKREAMQATVLRLAEIVGQSTITAHPLDYYWNLRDAIPRAAAEASAALSLAEPLPALAAYVCYAAIDMALLDAFGRANGVCTYAGLGPQHCAHDLGYYLGRGFDGRFPSDYVSTKPAAAVPFAHTVGGADPLTDADVDPNAAHDGLPQTLEAWIHRDGVQFLKLKLSGADTEAALRRTIDVHSVLARIYTGPGGVTADFNEACAGPECVVEYLRKLRERSPAAFGDLLYVEQPFDRAAELTREDVARVQSLKPLVADEAMTDCESVRRVLDTGWSGIALKVAKVMSSGLLHLAAARQAGCLLTVQDLCNSGLAHLASVGLAARLPLVGGVECNGRQFVPDAFPHVRAAQPEAFRFRDGVCATSRLGGEGLAF